MKFNDERSALQYIEKQLCSLVQSAIANTIEERGYWGLGDSDIFVNLEKLTESSKMKYSVEILFTSHTSGETDWTLSCRLIENLADIISDLNKSAEFDVQVASSEEEIDIFYAKKKIIIHNCRLDINASDRIINTAEKLEKNLLFFSIASS